MGLKQSKHSEMLIYVNAVVKQLIELQENHNKLAELVLKYMQAHGRLHEALDTSS